MPPPDEPNPRAHLGRSPASPPRPGRGRIGARPHARGTAAADLNVAGTAATGQTTIDGNPTKTIAVGANDTLTSVAAAINAAHAGVTATIISDGSTTAPYRLSVTADNSGTAGAVTFDAGTTGLAAQTLVAAQDAAPGHEVVELHVDVLEVAGAAGGVVGHPAVQNAVGVHGEQVAVGGLEGGAIAAGVDDLPEVAVGVVERLDLLEGRRQRLGELVGEPEQPHLAVGVERDQWGSRPRCPRPR